MTEVVSAVYFSIDNDRSVSLETDHFENEDAALDFITDLSDLSDELESFWECIIQKDDYDYNQRLTYIAAMASDYFKSEFSMLDDPDFETFMETLDRFIESSKNVKFKVSSSKMQVIVKEPEMTKVYRIHGTEGSEGSEETVTSEETGSDADDDSE